MGLLSVVEELSFQTAPTSHLIKPTVGPYPHADHDDNGEDDYDGGHGGPGDEYDGGDGGNDDGGALSTKPPHSRCLCTSTLCWGLAARPD